MSRAIFSCLLVLLGSFFSAMASELEPVMFVTGVVNKGGLAEAQAEVARQRRAATQQLEQALARGDAAAKGQVPPEAVASETAEAQAMRNEAMQQLAQATAREAALAQVVADATQRVADFGAILATTIKKELGCARVVQEDELSVFMERQREQALAEATTGADPLESGNGQVLEAEYEVKVSGTLTLHGAQSGSAAMTATCIHRKTSTVLASVNTDGANDSLPGLADTFIGQMARFEVCPYLGTVSVSVELDRDDDKQSEHPVYCNQRDGRSLRKERQQGSSRQQWALLKTGRRAASGDVTHSDWEASDFLEENDCYSCVPGREGHRVHSKKRSSNSTVTGLSEDSAAQPGETLNKDSRIRIRFLNGGAYMLKIEAVSKNGTALVDLEEKATGICQEINNDPPPEQKARDVHLSGEWGPFRGSPTDKHLGDTRNEPLNNPDIGETGKRILKFDLKRQ